VAAALLYDLAELIPGCIDGHRNSGTGNHGLPTRTLDRLRFCFSVPRPQLRTARKVAHAVNQVRLEEAGTGGVALYRCRGNRFPRTPRTVSEALRQEDPEGWRSWQGRGGFDTVG